MHIIVCCLVLGSFGILAWALTLKVDVDKKREELGNLKSLHALCKPADVPAKRSHHHPYGDVEPGQERDADGEARE